MTSTAAMPTPERSAAANRALSSHVDVVPQVLGHRTFSESQIALHVAEVVVVVALKEMSMQLGETAWAAVHVLALVGPQYKH